MSSSSFPAELLIADTSPLLALARVDALALLPALFARVWVPEVVVQECLAKPLRADAQRIGQALDAGLLAVVADPPVRLALSGLDAGEQAAIELALQHEAVVLLDERRGRALARQQGVKVLGAIGVLLLAKQRGHLPVVRPSLLALKASGYYLSDQLLREALQLAGE